MPARQTGRAFAVSSRLRRISHASLLITPRSAQSITITRSNRPKTIDSVAVEYTDALTGAPANYRFVPPGGTANNVQTLSLPFCRDDATAQSIARYSYNALYRQGAIARVDIADEGNALAPLDRVLFAAPEYGEAIACGVLHPGDDWTASAPAGSSPCVVYVRASDGSPDGPHQASIGQDGKIYAASSTPSVDLPTHGAEWAAWSREPKRWAIADIKQSGPTTWTADLVEEL